MELFERGRVDPSALRELAAGAAGRELGDDALREGLAAVARSHSQAVTWQVFGTPTLVDGPARAYLKLAEDPAPERSREVHDAVLAVLTGTPEVMEIKRPA